MTPEQLEALDLLRQYTNGTFDVWMLAGPANRNRRKHLMQTINTGARVPVSMCGIINLRSELYKIIKPVGNCIAAREKDFINKVQQVLK